MLSSYVTLHVKVNQTSDNTGLGSSLYVWMQDNECCRQANATL